MPGMAELPIIEFANAAPFMPAPRGIVARREISSFECSVCRLWRWKPGILLGSRATDFLRGQSEGPSTPLRPSENQTSDNSLKFRTELQCGNNCMTEQGVEHFQITRENLFAKRAGGARATVIQHSPFLRQEYVRLRLLAIRVGMPSGCGLRPSQLLPDPRLPGQPGGFVPAGSIPPVCKKRLFCYPDPI